MPSSRGSNPAAESADLEARPYRSASKARLPEQGVALCLSGGGFRAMLFHVGVILRLNDSALLPSLARVSSVSGGSITAARLALAWDSLDFDSSRVARSIEREFVRPVRKLKPASGSTFPPLCAAWGCLRAPWRSRSHVPMTSTSWAAPPCKPCRTSRASSSTPRTLQWRPHAVLKPYLADYRVGRCRRTETAARQRRWPPLQRSPRSRHRPSLDLAPRRLGEPGRRKT